MKIDAPEEYHSITVQWRKDADDGIQMNINSDSDMSVLLFMDIYVGMFQWMIEEQLDSGADSKFIDGMYKYAAQALRMAREKTEYLPSEELN